MYRIKKTFEVAVSHKLDLPYDSPCQRDHGHNLLITVYCCCANDGLDEQGMVTDFTKIKEIVHGQLDHRCLNDIKGIGWEEGESGQVIEKNPTAERLAFWIFMKVDDCYRVDVQESSGNVATYEDE